MNASPQPFARIGPKLGRQRVNRLLKCAAHDFVGRSLRAAWQIERRIGRIAKGPRLQIFVKWRLTGADRQIAVKRRRHVISLPPRPEGVAQVGCPEGPPDRRGGGICIHVSIPVGEQRLSLALLGRERLTPQGAEKLGHDQAGQVIAGAVLQSRKIFHRHVVVRRQEVIDFVRPITVGKKVPRCADIVGILVSDFALIGRKNHVTRRIVDLRHVSIGDGADHVLSACSGQRQPRITVLDDGIIAGGNESDVAPVVGVYEILRGCVPVAERAAELREVARSDDAEQAGQVRRRQRSHPIHRESLPVLGHDGTVNGQIDGELNGRAIFDRNHVVNDLHGAPGSVPKVGAGMFGTGFLSVEERRLVLDVRQRPRYVPIVSNQNHRQSGNADAAKMITWGARGDLIPNRRQRLIEVRIACQHRLACGGFGTVDRPVVAVRSMVKRGLRERLEALDDRCNRLRLAHAHAPRSCNGGDAAIFVWARIVRVLPIGGKDWKPGHSPPVTERFDHERVVEGPRAKVESLCHDALNHETVDRGPELWLIAEQLKQHRKASRCRILCNDVIHALTVGKERLSRRTVCGHLPPFQLRRAQDPQLVFELVGRERRGTNHLREQSLALTAHQVHLKQAEFGVQVPDRKKQIMVCFRMDVGRTVLVKRDLDRVVQTGGLKGLGGWQVRAGCDGPDACAGIECRAERREWARAIRSQVRKPGSRKERGG